MPSGRKDATARGRDFLLRIRGTVQGVGFRPFIARLAAAESLSGWVHNDAGGVTVRLACSEEKATRFAGRIRGEAPPAAVVDSIRIENPDTSRSVLPPLPADGSFEIRESPCGGERVAAVTPDLAICGDCRRELNDRNDRRWHYPFINCTNCGPRYSIVRDLPYDRERTTMAAFTMCTECAREYGDPLDRRFHAQPNACPACGPSIRLLDAHGTTTGAREAALASAVEALQRGRILAVKGLGGFHLCVDATAEESVALLRKRKHRDRKPFAVMFPNRQCLEKHAEVTSEEWDALSSPAAPIVLVALKPGGGLAPSVAPGNPWIGALLPYTPLHVLLMEAFGKPLVATSGNLSEEPLCTANTEARERLATIADLFLVHNRDIARPVEDSVVRFTPHGPLMLRRGRGYAPAPLPLPGGLETGEPLLSVGGHLKNTIALTLGDQVILSPHIGDLSNALAVGAFERTIELLGGLYQKRPTRIACDLHPEYASTRYAESVGLPVIPVQHHLAHVLAALLEDGGGPDRVLGVSWDGTGYGEDGTIWGGEFILIDRKAGTARRVAHLRPFPLPGGDAAARQTARCALGCLWKTGLMDDPACRKRLLKVDGLSERNRSLLLQTLEKDIRCPTTSSAGRLFDAVASLLGLSRGNTFEGEAGMAVEFAASRSNGKQKPFPWNHTESGPLILDWAPMLEAICSELGTGIPAANLAMRFHATLAEMIAQVASTTGIEAVALTGGCFQNPVLSTLAADALEARGHRLLLHHRLPPGDNNIAAGQALGAIWGITRVGIPKCP